MEARGLVLPGIAREKLVQALRQAFRILGHLERGQLRPRRRMVFERLPVEREAKLFSFGVLFLLVEALPGLIAEPAPLEHRLDERGHAHLFGGRCAQPGEIRGDVHHHVKTHQVGQAEGSGAGPADRCAGERIHLFDREVFALHQPHRLQHDEDPDPVGDEVGRVAREDHFFAEVQVRKAGDGLDGVPVGFRGRDDFDQPHIARRIEEMRPEPPAPQVIRQHRGDRSDGQAARVGGENDVRLQVRSGLFEQRLFDLQVLGDRLDHPVAAAQQPQIVLEIAGGDPRRQRSVEKCRGLALLEVFERLHGNRASRRAWRRQVQKRYRHSGIRQMGGYPRTHGSRAQHRGFADQYRRSMFGSNGVG